MLNKEKYFKVFISSMSEVVNEDKALCELVLPSDLINYIGEELKLKNIIEWDRNSFRLIVNKNTIDDSITYNIDVTRESGFVISEYKIVITDSKTGIVEIYHYFSDGPSLPDSPYKLKYCMIKRDSKGVYVMFLLEYKIVKEKKLYSNMKYYNNRVLEIIGNEYEDYNVLFMMRTFGFSSDSDKFQDTGYSPSSLTEAYKCFEEVSSGLFQKRKVTLDLSKGGFSC